MITYQQCRLSALLLQFHLNRLIDAIAKEPIARLMDDIHFHRQACQESRQVFTLIGLGEHATANVILRGEETGKRRRVITRVDGPIRTVHPEIFDVGHR